MAQTFYVNPGTGSDSAAGSQSAPFKTITKALQSAQSDTTIQLAAGTYNAASGESFPLKVPSGVKIVGNENNKGSGILIEGSGQYLSRTLAGQNVTFQLESKAELRGVTVTNPATRGTGVWIESTDPTVANSTLTKCKREGVLATGDANPVILNNDFIENLGNGIAITRDTRGEIRGNTCKKTGIGISIDSNAAPKVIDNKLIENRYGMVISGDSQPVLRNNLIENNTDDGISITGKAVPNLGTNSDAGKNTLRNNGKFDLNNTTSTELVVVGNQLNPSKTKGRISVDGIAYNNQGTGGGQQPDGDGEKPDGGGEKPDGGGKPTKLTDIAGHWAEPFIQGLFDKGLINGYSDGTFKPDAQMTRAEYAALIVKAFNPAPKREAPKFTDVAADSWAKDVIEKAYRGGFLSGYENNSFKPNDKVQRVQVIVSLVNGLGLSAADANALNFYEDKSAIPDYAKDEVVTATKKEIVVNHPQLKKLQPTKDATRAEIAAMVYQALVDANRVSALNSQYIVKNVQPSQLADIQNHWAKPFIEGLVSQGIASGYSDGTFKPDATMTRAEYAALIVKAFNPAPKREAPKFTDVAADSWAKDVIEKAYRGGFLSGYENNTFKANDKVQRVQVIVSLVNGLGLSAADANALNFYEDKSAIPDYAKDEVVTATKKEIVVNHPQLKKLQPTKDATRAEVAAMVYQALVDANRVSAINSDYIVTA